MICQSRAEFNRAIENWNRNPVVQLPLSVLCASLPLMTNIHSKFRLEWAIRKTPSCILDFFPKLWTN